jgi:hypothetical protein
MITRLFPLIGATLLLAWESLAPADIRQAVITGAGGNGMCTVEVTVDGSAEVDISADRGSLTTLSGRRAAWRRFECNTALPRDPADLRFVLVAGRGQAVLAREPRNNRGTATIRISDPKGGPASYVFNLLWRESRWPPPDPAPLPGRGSWQNGSGLQTAIRTCHDAVTGRLSRDGYRWVNIESSVPHLRPAGYDWIEGSVSGRRGSEAARFAFSCTANFRSGSVIAVDVRRR